MFFLQLCAASGGQRGGSASRGPSLTPQLWVVVSLWGPQGLGQGGGHGSCREGSSSSRLRTASALTWLPLLPSSMGTHHRLVKAACFSQGSLVYGLYFASRPARASLPASVHSLSRHQFVGRVRVPTLIKAPASDLQ